MTAFKRDAIQGEFCGGGIQKNRLKLKHPEWYVFTVINLTTHRRVSLEEMEELYRALELSMKVLNNDYLLKE